MILIALSSHTVISEVFSWQFFDNRYENFIIAQIRLILGQDYSTKDIISFIPEKREEKKFDDPFGTGTVSHTIGYLVSSAVYSDEQKGSSQKVVIKGYKDLENNSGSGQRWGRHIRYKT